MSLGRVDFGDDNLAFCATTGTSLTSADVMASVRQVMADFREADRKYREEFGHGINDSILVVATDAQRKEIESDARFSAAMSDPLVAKKIRFSGIPLESSLTDKEGNECVGLLNLDYNP